MENHDSTVGSMEPRTGKQLHHGRFYPYPLGHSHYYRTAADNPSKETFVVGYMDCNMEGLFTFMLV